MALETASPAVEKPVSAAPTGAGRQWLSDIERLKGLAIILVAWAHVHDAAFPSWALDLRRAIYAFHMPLFMFLSGYVFIYVNAHQLRGSFGRYVRKRAQRLLIPFFVMATLVILAKLAAGQVMSVDKPVNDVLQSFYSVFFNTEASPVQFIWYLIILFYLSILTAFLFSRLHISLTTLFIASIAMHVVHVLLYYQDIKLDFLYFNRVLMYYVFFMSGCMACLHRDVWLAFVDRYWLPAILVFLALVYLLFDSEWRYLFVGAASMVLFHGMIRKLLDGNRLLEFIGQNAFAIYLLNMLFIGLVKGLFGKFIAPPADHALVAIVLCTLAAVVGSIIIKQTMKLFPVLKPVVSAME